MRETGRLDAALTACDGLIVLNPRQGQAHAVKGLCLLELQRASEAAAEFAAALELEDSAANRYYLALALEAQAQWVDALAAYQAGVERYPQDPQLAAGYLALLTDQGRGADAVAAYGRLRQAGLRLDATELARLGAAALDQGQTGLAGTLYRDWAALDSTDPVELQGYFAYLLRQGQLEELQRYLDQRAPVLAAADYELVLQSLLVACTETQQLAGGIEVFSAEAAARPHPAAFLALSVLLSQSGDNSGALRQVQAGLERYPDHYYLRLRLAVLRQRVEGASAALAAAQAVLEHPELNASGYEIAGEIFTQAGELALATATAREGLERYPADATLLGQLAEALFAQADYAGVLAVLSDPAYASADYPRRDELAGRCELNLLAFARAVADFSRATAREPQAAGLWALLGEAQYFLGTYPDAREALTRAINLDDAVPAAHLWLGWVLIEQGELAGAEQSLATAESLPAARGVELGWCALGRAKLALTRGERAAAQAALSAAARYDVQDLRFQSKLQELTAQAGE